MQDNSLSLIQLIWHANFIVQLIMLALVAMSVYSWAIILEVNNRVKKYKHEQIRFDKLFWAGHHIQKLYEYYLQHKENIFGKSIIFCSALREYNNLKDTKILKGETILEGMERTVSIAISQEAKELEKKLPALGTIGAVAPYIGLVGTVWGIMSSFNTLGGVEQATISVVAPHIAEALIATALGLFVAIPAVIGHSRLSNQVDDILSTYESFQDDLCILLLKEAHNSDLVRDQQHNQESY
ncbi:protein TolQ [Allofrancisella guangzhouensis]|uniref:Colicin uptake protein TolQ n=1 Tax=Allofrancisella guangzhouensis TaxID=594679 RepID=A0A0A8E2M3_9GAMM|nr:protein TolQ [Allofrancisella guangzhouensis]AJC48194.1 colicin uptake protein TolQ [Allofrancisella guangzhouensis]MBK2027060.1 protein TolQ [Allofrancisella guangzhouensis]MBK2044550.1 protein TolQ [Allofrancisella guangzhouensis]MBK2046118.1 protein TolQ [Allofrancisella guangzhouensis]